MQKRSPGRGGGGEVDVKNQGEAPGFQYLPRDLANVNALENNI